MDKRINIMYSSTVIYYRPLVLQLSYVFTSILTYLSAHSHRTPLYAVGDGGGAFGQVPQNACRSCLLFFH